MEADDEAQSLEDGLWGVARDLDERLEETVTELAREGRPRRRHRRAGGGVPVRLPLRARAQRRGAAGPRHLEEERTVLGTFWRDTAVEQEEIEYFATGHPMVEALFGFLRDGPYGRNGAPVSREARRREGARARVAVPRRPARAGGHLAGRARAVAAALALPGPAADSRRGDRRTRREAEDRATSCSTREGVDGRSLKGDELRAAFPNLPQFLEPASQPPPRPRKSRAQGAAKGKKAIKAERTPLRRLSLR